MALTGHLSDLSLSELIEFFCNQRKSGQLKVCYPQGAGQFHLQAGSVVDAKIGVLRGIDAVHYALTLPNASFEFSSTDEATERTINQPWTQVVLEGLKRLDEGVVPPEAFPPGYRSPEESESSKVSPSIELYENYSLGVFSFGRESGSRRKPLVVAAVVAALLGSIAVIGVPAGWYGRPKVAAAAVTEPVKVAPAETQPETQPAPESANETVKSDDAEAAARASEAASLAAKKQREKEKAKAREETSSTTQSASSSPAPPAPTEPVKQGPKKISVTVTYDDAGRVTQASGSDPTALRIARQRRFPPGKAGSATITIPIN